MIYDCIIVGAGASGLFAGARFDTAAELAARLGQPPHPSRLPLAWQHPHPAARTKASLPEIDQSAAVLPAARPNTALPALILEKTGRAGTKLLMSGGGQCNITHGGSIKDFIDRYGKRRPHPQLPL